MRRSLIILSAASLLLLAACGEPDAPPSDTQVAAPDDAVLAEADTARLAPVEGLSNDQKLMLIEEVPLGLTYDQVQQRFPDLGAQQSEGSGATAHLTEAHLQTDVMDREALIEFNFENDRLYSYYYRIDSLDCAEGDSLYAELRDFYAGYYGDLREEEEDEGGYSARSSYWRMDEGQQGGAVTLSRQADECRLGWGFQQPAP